MRISLSYLLMKHLIRKSVSFPSDSCCSKQRILKALNLQSSKTCFWYWDFPCYHTVWHCSNKAFSVISHYLWFSYNSTLAFLPLLWWWHRVPRYWNAAFLMWMLPVALGCRSLWCWCYRSVACPRLPPASSASHPTGWRRWFLTQISLFWLQDEEERGDLGEKTGQHGRGEHDSLVQLLQPLRQFLMLSFDFYFFSSPLLAGRRPSAVCISWKRRGGSDDCWASRCDQAIMERCWGSGLLQQIKRIST